MIMESFIFYPLYSTSMSASQFRECMHRLMLDEEFLDVFRADPDAAIEEFDLTAEQKEALRSGKEDKIREFLGAMPADGALDVGSKTSPSASSVTEDVSGSALRLDD